jgi:hypothetical protein
MLLRADLGTLTATRLGGDAASLRSDHSNE